MSEIIAFDFEGAEVRTMYQGEDPWFVAMDVCKALGIVNSSDAIDRLDNDEKDEVGLTDAIGRKQDFTVINESGLYTLILRSRNAVKPGTLQHRFRKWVTSEVLPTIRKVGQYSLQRINTPSEAIEHRPTSYRVFEAIIRPDGPWGKIWAIPVYRLDDVDYWNVPLLLEAVSGSREIPSHINPRQNSYDLMQEHPDLPGAEPLRVASYRQLETLVPAAIGYLDKRTRELLQMIQDAPLREITRRGNNVVHLRDVTSEKP
jgi:prophage antirepressor-like protein